MAFTAAPAAPAPGRTVHAPAALSSSSCAAAPAARAGHGRTRKLLQGAGFIGTRAGARAAHFGTSVAAGPVRGAPQSRHGTSAPDQILASADSSATTWNAADTALEVAKAALEDAAVLEPARSLHSSAHVHHEPLPLPPDFTRQPCAHSGTEQHLLLCLPGLDAGRTLRDQTAAIADCFEVVQMNYGAEDRSALAEMAARVVEVARAELEARPGLKLWLLGESFGACVAVLVSARLGSAVERLVLVNPATSFAANPILPFGSPLLTLFPDPLFDLAKVVILPFIGDWSRIPPEGRDVDRVIASIPQRTTVHRLLQLRAFAGPAADRALARLACPTLVVASGRDRVLPSAQEAARLAALLPDCRSVLLPESGHACLLERGVSLRAIFESEGVLPPPPVDAEDDAEEEEEEGRGPVLQRAAFRGKRFPAGYEPPSDADMAELRSRYAPWRAATDPLFYGLHRVPHAREAKGPLLFVGNHTTYGLFDTPLLVLEVFYERGLALRSLAHESHWSFEAANGRGLASSFERYGAVRATARNFYDLLEAGEPVLLFPGGAREVCKRKGEKYRLFWKENTDFVRVAMRHGATVVPFSAVGAEELLDIAVDATEMRSALASSPLLAQLDARLEEIGVPQGEWFPVPAPGLNLQRLYFRFGEPIDLSGYTRKDLKDAELCSGIYGRVRSEVEAGIEWLHERRGEDPEADLAPRLLRQAVGAAASAFFALQDAGRQRGQP